MPITPEEPRLAGDYHESTEFEGLALAGALLADLEFLDVRFAGCDFTEAEIRGCRFESCRFERCTLPMMRPVDSVFHGVEFRESKLLGVDFGIASSVMAMELRFVSCDLSFSSFVECRLRGLELRDCTAREADLNHADLTGASFPGTDLEGTRFGGTNLARADFTTARNYFLDPRENRLKETRFALPEAVTLLRAFDIVLE